MRGGLCTHPAAAGCSSRSRSAGSSGAAMLLRPQLRSSSLSIRSIACRRPRLWHSTGCAASGGGSNDTQHGPSPSPRVIVVGGGASGLTAALFAAQSGATVTVLERTRECGKKILMSGGSRCNVLPKFCIMEQDFFTESSKSALRAVFASWRLEEVKEWLENKDGGLGLQLGLEEETNKYFPLSNSSKQVRDNLVAACEQSGVQFRYNASVEGISRLADGGWRCEMAHELEGSSTECDRLIVSTGGLSFPKVGTDGTGHRFMQRMGHTLGKGVYPALTPLLAPHPGGASLAGVSLYSVGLECMEAAVPGKKRKKKKGVEAVRTGLLFTHKGYSGPSILDLSHRTVQALERKEPLPVLRVSWTGEAASVWEERLAKGGPGLVLNVLKKHLPDRLAEALYAEASVADGRKLSELRKEERLALLALLSGYQIPVTGHQGYAKAEVTGGGIPLKEINCATMESKVAPGLHLCGEICDVFGRIGGFNFYWAWVSGRLAGLGAAAVPILDDK